MTTMAKHWGLNSFLIELQSNCHVIFANLNGEGHYLLFGEPATEIWPSP